MKFYYLIAFISLFLIGCSSIYTVSDFSSKENFYADFNNSTLDESVKVTLTNDSLFNINSGVKISNDTLYSIKYTMTSQYRKIALPEISSINYTSPDYKSGDILLKSNELLKAEKIRVISDSVEFTEIRRLKTLNNIANINQVKQVSYKEHWKGIIPGFLLGVPAGAILVSTKIIPTNVDEGNPPQSTYDYLGAVLIRVPLCILVGSAVGWLVGYTYIYQFNP